MPTGQAQPAHLTAHRRRGAVDPRIRAEAHHVAPAGFTVKPADQLLTGKGAIRQKRDGAERSQEPIGLLQQSDRNRGTDAGTGMLQRSPQQRNGSAVAHHGENHHAAAVPEHRGVQRQMQGLAWLLPVLQGPEHQGTIERLHIDAGIAQPALAASLPTGRQAMAQRQNGLPAVETDYLAQ